MKDDCEDEFHLRLHSQGCIFPKNPGGMFPCVHADTAQVHTHMHRDSDARMDKGNSLKSLSREVVTSAALFTRLMPHCTQERVIERHSFFMLLLTGIRYADTLNNNYYYYYSWVIAKHHNYYTCTAHVTADNLSLHNIVLSL